MPAGRPTEYRSKFCQAAHAMALQGATDREIAEELGVDERTLYRWKHAHAEFRQALRLGKSAADDRVENALYRRAIGYSFDALKIMQHDGRVIVKPYVEHVPPDVGAIKLWLTNRRADRWRDKQTQEVTGEGGGPVQLERIERVIVDPEKRDA